MGAPPVTLADGSQTLAAAGALNSVVIQR